jgi:hypothetical protein
MNNTTDQATNNTNEADAVAPDWVDRFWALVELVDWPARQYVTREEATMQLMARFTPGEAKRFDRFVRQLAEPLRAAVLDLCDSGHFLPGGDDALDDLVHHIIGLGREEYDRALAAPERAISRGQCGGYTESFLYVIPDEMDERKPNSDAYGDRARALRSGYAQLYGRPELRCFLPMIRETIRLLRALEEGDSQTFIRNIDRGRRIAADLADDIDALVEALRIAGISYIAPDVPDAELRKLYRDARRWLVEYPTERARALAAGPNPAAKEPTMPLSVG